MPGPARRAWQASRPVALPVLTALAGLLFWQTACDQFGILEVVLPSPLAILETLQRGSNLILRHAVPTAKEAILTFLLACSLGITIATVISYSRILRECLLPNLIALQFIPKVALAPLFIIWFGLGIESRLTFAVFVSFFPVMIATATGLTNTPPEFLRLGRVLSASRRQTFSMIRFPTALPYMFSGMKIAVTMSMIGVIVGEFITAREGLGYLILFASSRTETALIFACLLLLCCIGLGMFGCLALVELAFRRRFGFGASR